MEVLIGGAWSFVWLKRFTKMTFHTHKEMDKLGVQFRSIAPAWHVKAPGFDLRTEDNNNKNLTDDNKWRT